jgi:putative PIN family toxin of toxin-antitoxin system
MFRAVLDTNVLVSALIKPGGKPGQIVAQHTKFEVILSDDILVEARDVLHRKHIQKRFHLPDDEIEEFLGALRTFSTMIIGAPVENVIPNDPPDNLVLACAVGGEANYLVSGNEHILNLDNYRGIKMVKPAEFLRILEGIQ